MTFSPGAFFDGQGKSGGHTGQAKSTRHVPVEPAKEPVEGEIGSDESVQILEKSSFHTEIGI